MKNIQLILVLIGVFAVSNLAIAQMNSAYDKLNPELTANLQLPTPTPYEQLEKTVNSYNIHQLFEQYKQRATKFTAIEDDYIATFDLLMDKNMVIESLVLGDQLNKALQAKVPLQEFEPIGLSQRQENGKNFTVKQTISFKAPMIVLFRFSRASSNNYLANQLTNRGFKRADLQQLFEYTNHIQPMKYADKYIAEFILSRLPTLKRQFKSKQTNRKQLYRDFNQQLTYFKTYVRVKLWRQWLLNLLNQFEPQQQRIVKSLIIELLEDEQSTHHQIIEDPSLFELFEQKLLSGQYEQQQRKIYDTYFKESVSQ